MTVLINIAFVLAVIAAGISIPLLIFKGLRRYPKSTAAIVLLALFCAVMAAERLFPGCHMHNGFGGMYASCPR
jgi:uncharacterized membrane protein